MNKRIIAVASALALTGCLGLFGCGSEEPVEPATDGAAQTEEATQAAEPAEEAPASDYEVTIDDATVSEDYEGNPVVVVSFSWVNNSEDATSADVALYTQCFQNGVELEQAYVVDGMDDQSSMNDVKPGSGTDFQKAYLIEDESDVTVEVTEFISLDDTILAEKTFSIA